MIKRVQLREFEIGGAELVFIGGPCVIEDDPVIVFQTAEKLKTITAQLKIPYIFKSSYDKANRSSLDSYRGVGIERGLEILAEVQARFDLPILTDIHSPTDAARA